VTLLTAVAIGTYKLVFRRPGVKLTPEKMVITKLTDDASVFHAALSPDGRYVAYISRQGGQSRLWLRQIVAESAVQLLPGSQMDYSWVGFSPDGDYIYFQADRGRHLSVHRPDSRRHTSVNNQECDASWRWDLP
jgi:hypothetical protein